MALTDNIISYWKLDGNSNDSVTTNNGTDTDITYNSGNGKIIQGAGFNGTTSVINFGNVLGATFTSAFSVSFWVNYIDLVIAQDVFSKVNTNTVPNPIDIYILDDGKIRFMLGNGGSTFPGDYWWTNSDTSLTASAWNHVVCTYDNSGTFAGMKTYINGVLSTDTDNGTVGTATNNSMDLWIGNRNTEDQPLQGDIDEVGVWSRAITVGEVTELYNSGTGNSFNFATAPKVESYSYVNYDNTASMVVDKPIGLAVGDVMIAHLSIDTGYGSITPPDFSQIGFTTGGGAVNGFYYYKIVDSDDVAASNFTFTLENSSDRAMALIRISGADTNFSNWEWGGNDKTTTNTSTPSINATITPSVPSLILQLWCANSSIIGINNYAIATDNPVWGELYTISDGGGRVMTLAYANRTETTATGNTSANGGSGSTDWCLGFLAIPPAGEASVTGNAMFMGANM